MTKPREKKREELQAEIEDGKKKIRQLENREKVLRQKLSQEERRTRSHRLVVRGAVFESIVPEAKTMTDEEAAAFLRLALTSEEARAYLAKADRLETSYHSDLYRGMILEKEGRLEEAAACWEGMTEKYPDTWLSWFARADRLARRCAYAEAVTLYEKALELSPRPRFTDPVNAIAQLYEIQRQYEKAIEFYQKEIEIVREDWNETQGEAIDEPLRNIARLKEKMIE